MKVLLLSLFVSIAFLSFCQDSNHYENESVSYGELMRRCIAAVEGNEQAKMEVIGTTDVGKPLHLITISSIKKGEIEDYDGKVKLLINNGIHPGEPCGIDASLLLIEEILSDTAKVLPENVILYFIPIYNVGGMLNRGCCSRANQNGPEEYGFRGNAKNLDLNRDFIKCDSHNARSFSQLYSWLQPDIFVDTHTSNGADYQYTMTLIHSQEDKAGKAMGNFLVNELNPALYAAMEEKDFPMIPYVHMMGRTPETGIKNFMETPRYSTGYAALHQGIGFVTETHMFKPFADRVESTKAFLETLIDYCDSNANSLLDLRAKLRTELDKQRYFDLQWELDTTSIDSLLFKGYEAITEDSKLDGNKRLRYDRDQPYSRNVAYFPNYKATVSVKAPSVYVIPQGWSEVIERLAINGVEMEVLDKDTTLTVEAYYIEDLKTKSDPYEGHFLHSNVQVAKHQMQMAFHQGDVLIPVQQWAKRFIVETLEPQGVDSYFAWGFFDSILQQKEWFSDYIFEEQAIALLEGDAALKAEFEKALKANPDMEGNHWSQLYWLYAHSPNFETSYNRYPVYRFVD